MKTEPLTFRQLETLTAIEQFSETNGYPPSQRELCSVLGLRSTNAVADLLAQLERKGWIRRTPKVSRAIVVVRRRRPRHRGRK